LIAGRSANGSDESERLLGGELVGDWEGEVSSCLVFFLCWNIVTSSKINENAVKDIGLPSSKWLGHRPRKLGNVGSSPTGSDISRVFSSIFKFVFF